MPSMPPAIRWGRENMSSTCASRIRPTRQGHLRPRVASHAGPAPRTYVDMGFLHMCVHKYVHILIPIYMHGYAHIRLRMDRRKAPQPHHELRCRMPTESKEGTLSSLPGLFAAVSCKLDDFVDGYSHSAGNPVDQTG